MVKLFPGYDVVLVGIVVTGGESGGGGGVGVERSEWMGRRVSPEQTPFCGCRERLKHPRTKHTHKHTHTHTHTQLN